MDCSFVSVFYQYRTCVRNCQDIFSALFVTNTLEEFKGMLYVPGRRPESLHRIVRRIGLKMRCFCHHHIAMRTLSVWWAISIRAP